MTRWFLNAAAMPDEGVYRLRYITLDDAVAWLQLGDFVSRIGYPINAELMKEAAGVDVPVNRDAHAMQPGDEALVMQLRYRLPDAKQKATTRPAMGDFKFSIMRMHPLHTLLMTVPPSQLVVRLQCLYDQIARLEMAGQPTAADALRQLAGDAHHLVDEVGIQERLADWQLHHLRDREE